MSEFRGKINYTLNIKKGNAEPDYAWPRFMSRPSHGSWCGPAFCSDSSAILTYISGEKCIVAN